MMNKRNTTQRSLVLATVQDSQSHPTADEVYRIIAKKYPHISRGTVYRNLNLLSELGEIRKVEVPNGADRFDYLRAEHYHARCIKCGEIFNVEMAFIADLEKNIKDSHGFDFTGHDIMFKGICSSCQK